MSAPKPITIVGGGLAGLSLGIGLRQRGIPVVVWEAGRYPRHRVCGEFVCGRGQEVLAQLGLRDPLVQAGATIARTAAFYLGRASSPVRRLSLPALCLSRFTMDALLAQVFREQGGDLRQNARWRDDGFSEGIVRASGRRLKPREDGWQWWGLKAHARGSATVADLEMHGLPNGYVGLCRLQGEVVNVCGLFRRRAGSASARPWQEMLCGNPGTPLHDRLGKAVFDEDSFCSVAGFSLKPVRGTSLAECCIGDALTMIPPVTGNGMSMAFEAASIAVDPLAAYSRGEVSWAGAREAVARACDGAFKRRLAWARCLQWMMFTPVLRTRWGNMALCSDCLWRTMFEKTR